ncbi:DUF4031 domain-containing protein [Microbacterium enclense]|uniref:DUF4031 domain-containing protein n=1 Tax=Microbacterium enclense TaxID=993073 RepID=A0A1G6NSM5_9MICO|nr:DUF4031 domain-containing protein [Microbacterium enclense]SDC70799.1 Protein of unknown function [Microbacterium enclense]
MTVYVDDMFMKATVPNGARKVSGEWCHMQADTREELDDMADKIGLRRSWIQYPGTWKEHYDVTRPRRDAAIAAGAVPVGMLELARIRKRWREEHRSSVQECECSEFAQQHAITDPGCPAHESSDPS